MTPLDPPKVTASTLSPAARLRRGRAGRAQGLGTTTITVKAVRATAQQRDAINEALSIAQSKRAPRNAILGLLCAGTAESTWRPSLKNPGSTANGVLQALETGLSTAQQVTFWLDGGHGFQGGGGIALARQGLSPGEIAARVEAGELTAGGYAVFVEEAKRTLQAFAGGALGSAVALSLDGKKVAEPYLLERGTRKGAKENSWDAMRRLAEPVNFRRWAALNTLFYVSDDELRAAAASLTIHGDEGWLLSRPTFEETGSGLVDTEVGLQVLSERWGVLPGAVVEMADQGAINGRYLVASVVDDLWSPRSTITLRRPVPAKPEPARETRTVSVTGTTKDSTEIASPSLTSLSPKLVIDRVILPIARSHGINVTPQSVAAANAVHGHTVTGSTSDHEGPPDVAWAADMSNGSAPTTQMDALADELARKFGFPVSNAADNRYPFSPNVVKYGFRFQLGYRTNVGGNHYNHVHFGCRKI